MEQDQHADTPTASNYIISNFCEFYDPDKVFQRFKVIEFPRSFVGLSTSKELDIEVDINKCGYLKTNCEDKLMKFDEAREISPSHRAFTLTPLNNHSFTVTFIPTTECISKMTRKKIRSDCRFICDLRLIKTIGHICCGIESHSEIGRYYFSGQYELCEISHTPIIVEFGKIAINEKLARYIRIHNASNFMTAKVNYVKATGFEVMPRSFSLPPNSTKRLQITLKPTALKVVNVLNFTIRNPHDTFGEAQKPYDQVPDNNFISYSIGVNAEIFCNTKVSPQRTLCFKKESLHKLKECYPWETYMGDELTKKLEKKAIAFNFLKEAKKTIVRPHFIEKTSKKQIVQKAECYSENQITNKHKTTNQEFCKIIGRISSCELFDIELTPNIIYYGRVSFSTFGEQDVIIKNNSKHNVTIKLSKDHYVVYTSQKLPEVVIKLASGTSKTISVLCLGGITGNFTGTFVYFIDNKFEKRHAYNIVVGNPTLRLSDTITKFGMITNENFTTSVPIRIYNHFNVDIDFEWLKLQPDLPFEIIPTSGTVPKHECKLCDITYVCKPMKSKVYDVICYSKGHQIKTLNLELNIITRKLSIKFLQESIPVTFKDIPLNMECIQQAKMENASRELATFNVVEPLLYGIQVEPMDGIIRPRTIFLFDIIVKISYVIEFSLDILVKINNKETLVLPILGNVVEPKIIINPKKIFIPRVPMGLITFVPVALQNIGSSKTLVQVLHDDEENMFNIYVGHGNDKEEVSEFYIEMGHTKVIYIKVYGLYRREYSMYLQLKFNKLIGPPIETSPSSVELRNYIGAFEQFYTDDPKVEVKTITKEINYCHMSGMITLPWIEISEENFEIVYVPMGENSIEFTITNISKYYLYITIVISKLSPNFSLLLKSDEDELQQTDTHIKFDFDLERTAKFQVLFHPNSQGRFTAIALLYLDKFMSLPYHNLKFVGINLLPIITSSTCRIFFPPSPVGMEWTRVITVKINILSELDAFTCTSTEEEHLDVNFLSMENIVEDEQDFTIVTIEIRVCCHSPYTRFLTLSFHHECGSCCEVDVWFYYTFCPLTLHAQSFISSDESPYPYYPTNDQPQLYEYLERCTEFLEKWLFLQGFHKELYPEIPETFHNICAPTSSESCWKGKGIKATYFTFIKRIAGSLMKYIQKGSAYQHQLPVGDNIYYKELQDQLNTYRQIIHVLKCRGTNFVMLQPKYLLSHKHFVLFSELSPPKSTAEIALTEQLISDVDLFNRLSKQSWLDFILQTYKVFVVDSCFFDCGCVESQARNITHFLVDWYNENLLIAHKILRGNDKPVKHITNLTTDLTDGTALISAFYNHCPFLAVHFSDFHEIEGPCDLGGIISNACLILDAISQLKLYFPITCNDFLKPNFIQMLFLSIHLYVTLPMFKRREILHFQPPLLRSSSRTLIISPLLQEAFLCSYFILNNVKNSFVIEKPSIRGGRVYLKIKYIARFVSEERAIFIVQGYNKTHIFDTYMVFELVGSAGALQPVRKYKITGPLYRPNRVDIQVYTPFHKTAVYNLYTTEKEPSIPVTFEDNTKAQFHVKRLKVLEKQMTISGCVEENPKANFKLRIQVLCLSMLPSNCWVWFLSEVGQFFIKITTLSRLDTAIDLHVRPSTWPMDPCSCGEACECYRTAIVMIPHRNDVMLKSLRLALIENASDSMLKVYDELIGSEIGRIVLSMALKEQGTIMSEINHILQQKETFHITSRNVVPKVERVTLLHQSDAMFPLPISIPPDNKSEQFTVNFISDDGVDMRAYKIILLIP